MRLVRRSLVVLVLLSAASLRAQSSVPTLVQPVPAQTIALGGAAATIDLRQHLAVPGVVGRQFAQFETVVGRVNVELRNDVAPRHVANFLAYIQANAYTNTFLHRAASFDGGAVSIVQGGGYGYRLPFEVFTIAKQAPISLEYNLANGRGTLAAARTTDINSATSEWYFNVRDNSTILNQSNGGGYTVFGRVLGTGMTVVDAMAALPRVNAGSPFNELPVRNFSGGNVGEANLVTISAVRQISLYPDGTSAAIVQYGVVESSAPNVAIASISGSNLILTPVGPGSTTVTVRATDTNGNSAQAVVAVTVTGVALPARLSNLSVRAAMPAAQTLFVGFTMSGGAKPVLLRAVGPTLGQAPFNVAGTMADPRLALFRDATQLEANDNWGGSSALSTAFAGVGAFALPAASLDAALLRSVDGGHTAQVTGTGAGVVLVEAYDAGTGNSPRLVNVSARNRVGTGDNILIAGFTIAGPGSMSLLIRAVGPRLGQAPFNVGGVLADPVLEIYNSQNVKVTENDNWNASLAATFQSVGAFALEPGSRDAALLTTLPPGSYTAQVSGVAGGTGEALVEIYEIR